VVDFYVIVGKSREKRRNILEGFLRDRCFWSYQTVGDVISVSISSDGSYIAARSL